MCHDEQLEQFLTECQQAYLQLKQENQWLWDISEDWTFVINVVE